MPRLRWVVPLVALWSACSETREASTDLQAPRCQPATAPVLVHGAPLAPSEFCAAWTDAFCGYQATCAPAFEVEPAASCRARRLQSCDLVIADVAAEITAGRLAWSDQAAGDCVAAMRDGTCARGTRCPGVLTPAASVAASCLPDAPWLSLPPANRILLAESLDWPGECLEGWCGGSTCPGTCQPLRDVGDVCYDGYRQRWACRSGLYCRSSSLGGVVDSCQPRVGQGGGCTLHVGCLDGLYCRAGTCEPQVSQCEPCDSDAACADGACRDGVCRRANVGEGSPCSGRSCDGGLVCRCPAGDALLPSGRPACGRSTEGTFGTVGVCAPPGSDGTPCVNDWECARGLTCRSTATCGAPGGAGAACAIVWAAQGDPGDLDAPRVSYSPDCGAGLTCEDGRCTPRPTGAGDACTWGIGSFPGGSCYAADLVCTEVGGGGDVCLSPSAAGAACDQARGCVDGYYCDPFNQTCLTYAATGTDCSTNAWQCEDRCATAADGATTCQPFCAP